MRKSVNETERAIGSVNRKEKRDITYITSSVLEMNTNIVTAFPFRFIHFSFE